MPVCQQMFFPLEQNCPSQLKNVTKKTKLNLERTPSQEPEVFFSLPDGECAVLVVWLSLSRKKVYTGCKVSYIPFLSMLCEYYS